MRVVGGKIGPDGQMFASIVWTVPGGPAEKSGLQQGDKVLNSHRVRPHRCCQSLKRVLYFFLPSIGPRVGWHAVGQSQFRGGVRYHRPFRWRGGAVGGTRIRIVSFLFCFTFLPIFHQHLLKPHVPTYYWYLYIFHNVKF